MQLCGNIKKQILKLFFPSAVSPGIHLFSRSGKPSVLFFCLFSCERVYFKYQSSSVALLCPTLCDPMDCSTPGFPVYHQLLSLLKLMLKKLVMPSNSLILCHPFLLLPSILPRIRVFSNQPALRIRWPKDWNFSFSISPCNERSGLISFRMDCLDLLAVQGTFTSFLQHHSSKASILLMARAQLLPQALSLEGLYKNKA